MSRPASAAPSTTCLTVRSWRAGSRGAALFTRRSQLAPRAGTPTLLPRCGLSRRQSLPPSVSSISTQYYGVTARRCRCASFSSIRAPSRHQHESRNFRSTRTIRRTVDILEQRSRTCTSDAIRSGDQRHATNSAPALEKLLLRSPARQASMRCARAAPKHPAQHRPLHKGRMTFSVWTASAGAAGLTWRPGERLAIRPGRA